MSANVEALDLAIDAFKASWDNTRVYRNPAIAKLADVVTNMTIDPTQDKAMAIDAKLNIIKTLNDLLLSDESSALNHAKLVVRKKETEVNMASSKLVAEALRRIGRDHHPLPIGNPTEQQVNVDEAIESTYETNCTPITDDELLIV